MNSPEWLKPDVYGAMIRVGFVGAVGLVGRLGTGGTAHDRAMAMARDGVVASMVPVCPDMARSDAAPAGKLDTIRAASGYQWRDAVMTTGRATVPATGAPDRDIAQACLPALEL